MVQKRINVLGWLKNWIYDKEEVDDLLGNSNFYIGVSDDLHLYMGIVKNINIESSPQIVQVGDDFTIEVKATDNNNIPLIYVPITLTCSDGTVYNSSTNNQGIASFLISDLNNSGKYNFEASYSLLTTNCEIMNASFYDEATQNKHKSDYTNTSNKISVSYADDGTILDALTHSSGTQYVLNYNETGNKIVEFDIYKTSGNPRWYCQGNDFYLINARTPIDTWTHITMKYFNGETLAYSNDNKIDYIGTFNGNGPLGFFPNSSKMKFKNLIIYPYNEDLIVYDKGITGQKSSNWTFDNNGCEDSSVTTDTEGTLITATGAGYAPRYISDIELTGDFEITFTATHSACRAGFLQSNGAQNIAMLTGASSYEKECDFVIKRVNGVFYAKYRPINTVSWSNISFSDYSDTVQFGFFVQLVSQSTRYVKYHDLQISKYSYEPIYSLSFDSDTIYGEVGSSIPINVNLKDQYGYGLENKTITLTCNDTIYTSNTNSNGVASFSISDLSATGEFTFIASYGSLTTECTVINGVFYLPILSDQTSDLDGFYFTGSSGYSFAFSDEWHSVGNYSLKAVLDSSKWVAVRKDGTDQHELIDEVRHIKFTVHTTGRINGQFVSRKSDNTEVATTLQITEDGTYTIDAPTTDDIKKIDLRIGSASSSQVTVYVDNIVFY